MSQGLVFEYGSYKHPAGEVYPQVIEVRPVFSDRGVRWAKHVRYQLAGDLISTTGTDLTQAEVTTKCNALESLYREDYKDFGFYLSDGTTITSHYLYTDGPYNLSGNRVLSFGFHNRLPSEYANTRSFQVTLGALIKDSYSSIIFAKEVISQRGTGGEHWTYRPRYSGAPVRETIHSQTPILIQQSGVVVGLEAYPKVPAPWWPADELQSARVISRESGRLHGHPSLSRGTHYQLNYTYVFQMANTNSQSPNLFGNPTVNPISGTFPPATM